MKLEQITHYMFRTKYDRTNSSDEMKTYFIRFIGVDDPNNYDNCLKTLADKFKENKDTCIIFDNELPVIAELELINYINNELKNMNICNLKNEDVIIFNDIKVNNLFLEALDYVVTLAINRENFFNDNVRNNFITKIIVWAYSYLRGLSFDEIINPKCIYYGSIGRHEVYFLILLNKMKFDVLYINPLKEEYFEEIESSKNSILEKSLGIVQLESFKEKAARGRAITNVETITKQLEMEVRNELFTGTGAFVPWQFRNGYTKSLVLDTILEDIYVYWNEPAKLRTGFKVEGSTVSVPCFFRKIDGEYRDKFNYQRLVKYCLAGQNTLFYNTGSFSPVSGMHDAMYQLLFCQLSDGSFDIEELKKTNIYRYSKYSVEVQNYILNKFNETIMSKDLFVTPLNKEDTLRLLVLVLSMEDKLIRRIDNFDFTDQIPKLVIYLNNEEGIPDYLIMLLAYLHVVAFDIVIFNPSGLFNINRILKEKIVNVMRLEEMNYSSNYGHIIGLKQSVFSRILKK